MWKYYALLSALFAAATAILAKCGVKGINSNLATAIRTVVVLLLVWGVVVFSGGLAQCRDLSRRNLIFLVLSGVATGLSWLFYFRALQLAEVSKVAPIDKLSVAFAVLLGMVLLKESFSWTVVGGAAMIVGGSLLIFYGSR